MTSLRAWVPAAGVLELVECIARPGLYLLMEADEPAEGVTALPACDLGELLEDCVARCQELLP